MEAERASQYSPPPFSRSLGNFGKPTLDGFAKKNDSFIPIIAIMMSWEETLKSVYLAYYAEMFTGMHLRVHVECFRSIVRSIKTDLMHDEDKHVFSASLALGKGRRCNDWYLRQRVGACVGDSIKVAECDVSHAVENAFYSFILTYAGGLANGAMRLCIYLERRLLRYSSAHEKRELMSVCYVAKLSSGDVSVSRDIQYCPKRDALSIVCTVGEHTWKYSRDSAASKNVASLFKEFKAFLDKFDN
jgi:hypothetical protein